MKGFALRLVFEPEAQENSEMAYLFLYLLIYFFKLPWLLKNKRYFCELGRCAHVKRSVLIRNSINTFRSNDNKLK